jgi:transposase
MKRVIESYWGIDVSKEWLDIDTGKERLRIDQTEVAIKNFTKRQGQARNEQVLVVLESTGGYERLIVSHLSKAKFVVHVAHPSKVKSFARAKGRLAKTDKIDAKLLRDYGSFIELDEIRALPSEQQTQLKELGSRLDQLKDMHHQEICRLGMACGESVRESIKGILTMLKSQIKLIEEGIYSLIKIDVQLEEKYKILRSMKGVGPILAMKFITDLPELGEANKK